MLTYADVFADAQESRSGAGGERGGQSLEDILSLANQDALEVRIRGAAALRPLLTKPLCYHLNLYATN